MFSTPLFTVDALTGSVRTLKLDDCAVARGVVSFRRTRVGIGSAVFGRNRIDQSPDIAAGVGV